MDQIILSYSLTLFSHSSVEILAEKYLFPHSSRRLLWIDRYNLLNLFKIVENKCPTCNEELIADLEHFEIHKKCIIDPINDCAICIEPVKERSHSLSCGHTFCITCLIEIIKHNSTTCPQCRAEIIEYNLLNFEEILPNNENEYSDETINIEDFISSILHILSHGVRLSDNLIIQYDGHIPNNLIMISLFNSLMQIPGVLALARNGPNDIINLLDNSTRVNINEMLAAQLIAFNNIDRPSSQIMFMRAIYNVVTTQLNINSNNKMFLVPKNHFDIVSENYVITLTDNERKIPFMNNNEINLNISPIKINFNTKDRLRYLLANKMDILPAEYAELNESRKYIVDSFADIIYLCSMGMSDIMIKNYLKILTINIISHIIKCYKAGAIRQYINNNAPNIPEKMNNIFKDSAKLLTGYTVNLESTINEIMIHYREKLFERV
jgi:hypothetical protein